MLGKIYTTESRGGLYATDPANGTWKRIGKPEFINTAWLFGVSKSLYSIEKDGSWAGVGKKGVWSPTIAITAAAGKLYRVETNGRLFVTEPTTGAWKAIGRPEFLATRGMFGIGSKLYTIEADGSLYAVAIE